MIAKLVFHDHLYNLLPVLQPLSFSAELLKNLMLKLFYFLVHRTGGWHEEKLLFIFLTAVSSLKKMFLQKAD